MEKIQKVGFIGGGNMAEAIVKGLVQGAVAADNILVSEPFEQRRVYMEKEYAVGVTEDNSRVASECDLIVLAVKPQVAGLVLEGIAVDFTGNPLIVSIMAGVSTTAIEGHFEGSVRVVRAMPNTPALISQGATALCPGASATDADMECARSLFEAVGVVQFVGEGQMDAVTGVSGSGPAYIYSIIEALADGGVLEGLSRDVAHSLAVQTVLGAAKLVQESGEHPAVLRDRVCSPGGTTIAAVRTLEEKGMRSALIEAVSSAANRSRELG